MCLAATGLVDRLQKCTGTGVSRVLQQLPSITPHSDRASERAHDKRKHHYILCSIKLNVAFNTEIVLARDVYVWDSDGIICRRHATRVSSPMAKLHLICGQSKRLPCRTHLHVLPDWYLHFPLECARSPLSVNSTNQAAAKVNALKNRLRLWNCDNCVWKNSKSPFWMIATQKRSYIRNVVWILYHIQR